MAQDANGIRRQRYLREPIALASLLTTSIEALEEVILEDLIENIQNQLILDIAEPIVRKLVAEV